MMKRIKSLLLFFSLIVLISACKQPLKSLIIEEGERIFLNFDFTLNPAIGDPNDARWIQNAPLFTTLPTIDHWKVEMVPVDVLNPATPLTITSDQPNIAIDVGYWDYVITAYDLSNRVIGYQEFKNILLNSDIIAPIPIHGFFGQISGVTGTGDITLDINYGSLVNAASFNNSQTLGRLERVDLNGTVSQSWDLTGADFDDSVPGTLTFNRTGLNIGNYRIAVYLRDASSNFIATSAITSLKVYNQADIFYSLGLSGNEDPPVLVPPQSALTPLTANVEQNGLVFRWDNLENFLEDGYEITIYEDSSPTQLLPTITVPASQNSYVFNLDGATDLGLNHSYRFEIIATSTTFSDSSPIDITSAVLDEVWVHPTGHSNPADARPYADDAYRTLQDAYVAMTNAGLTTGTIHMAQGTYTVPDSFFISNNYYVIGSYSSDWSTGPDVSATPTVVNTASTSADQATITLSNGSLSFLTINGGSSTSNNTGALYIDSTVSVSNCILNGGSGSNSSVGLSVDAAGFTPVIQDCTINGGSGPANYGVYVIDGSPDFKDTDITDGLSVISAGNTSGLSRGVYIDGGSPSFENYDIRGGNTPASTYGVHISTNATTNTGTFTNCEITSGNSSGGDSFGFQIQGGGTSGSLSNCIISSGNGDNCWGVSLIGTSNITGISGGTISSGTASTGSSYAFYSSSTAFNGNLTGMESIDAGSAAQYSYGVYISSLSSYPGIISGLGKNSTSQITSGTSSGGVSIGVYIGSSFTGKIQNFGLISAGSSPSGQSIGINISTGAVFCGPQISQIGEILGGDAGAGGISHGMLLAGNFNGITIDNIGALTSSGSRPDGVSGGIRGGLGDDSTGLMITNTPSGIISINKAVIRGGQGGYSTGLLINNSLSQVYIYQSFIHGSDLGASGVSNSKGIHLTGSGGSSTSVSIDNSMINGGEGTSSALGLFSDATLASGADLNLNGCTVYAEDSAVGINSANLAAVIQNCYLENNSSLYTVKTLSGTFSVAFNFRYNTVYNRNTFSNQLDTTVFQGIMMDMYSATPANIYGNFNYCFPMAFYPATGYPSGRVPRSIAHQGSGLVGDDYLGNSRTFCMGAFEVAAYSLPMFLTVNDNSGQDTGIVNQSGETDFYSYLNLSEALALANDSYGTTYSGISLSSGLSQIDLDYTAKIGMPISFMGNNVILNGQGSRRILQIDNNNATYENFGPLSISNVIFEDGDASRGGAVLVAEHGVSLNFCTFRNNTAATHGGAIYYDGVNSSNTANTISFSDNQFIGNSVNTPGGSGDGGGAIYLTDVYSYDFYNCLFDSNYVSGSSGMGGAVYFATDLGIDSANTRIQRCDFMGNHAGNGGALFYRTDSIQNSNIRESVFFQNYTNSISSTNYGGAINIGFSAGGGTATEVNIANSVFAENMTTLGLGSAIYTTDSSVELNIQYSTFSRNNIKQIAIRNGSTLNIEYSIITGTGLTPGNDNSLFNDTGGIINMINTYYDRFSTVGGIVEDFEPFLQDIDNPAGSDGVWRTSDDGLIPLISLSSPYADTGIPSVTVDILGNARGTSPDPGAYEYQ